MKDILNKFLSFYEIERNADDSFDLLSVASVVMKYLFTAFMALDISEVILGALTGDGKRVLGGLFAVGIGALCLFIISGFHKSSALQKKILDHSSEVINESLELLKQEIQVAEKYKELVSCFVILGEYVEKKENKDIREIVWNTEELKKLRSIIKEPTKI